MDALQIVREFVRDIEAAYDDDLRSFDGDGYSFEDEWFDLHKTYQKAKALLAEVDNNA